MKKIILLAGIFALLCTFTLKAQVTIGKETPPDLSAVLQIISPDSTKGVLVPEMTADQRDKISKPANGLLIYNITEDCYNYWNAADSAWQSLCGGMSKAVYTLDCSTVVVNGTYVQGTALNGNDYLSMQVDVKKPGSYSITGTTSNSYGFNTQGTFLNTGLQTVLVPGQGQPKNASPAPGDPVTLTLSGAESGCTNIKIPVLPPTATYSLSCGSAVFNGVYIKGTPLTPSNTVTFNVNVAPIQGNANTWAVSSNTVNGISFSGSGAFAASGTQTIALQGTGTPTGTDPITLTFTTNSSDGAATCTATVNIAYSQMRILGSDGVNNNFGYGLNATSMARAMITSDANFGTKPTSTVKAITPTVDYHQSAATTTDDTYFQTNLLGANPYNIVVIGYDFFWDASKITTFLQYLNNGGVLVLLDENTVTTGGGMQSFMQQLYGNQSIVMTPAASGSPAQGIDGHGPYLIGSIPGDPISAGPFQPTGYTTLGGLGWGADATTASVLYGLPSNLIVYSTGYTAANGANGVTMFRDPTNNLFWVGDGGFDSDPAGYTGGNYSDPIDCPFAVTAATAYQPTPRTGWGAYAQAGSTVYNSYMFGNIMAWAINQAQITKNKKGL